MARGFAARARRRAACDEPLCHRRADRHVHHPDGRLWPAGDGRHGRPDQRRTIRIHGRRRLRCSQAFRHGRAVLARHSGGRTGRRHRIHRLRAAGDPRKRLLSGSDHAGGAGDVSDHRTGAAIRMARRNERHGGRADRDRRTHAFDASRHVLLHACRRADLQCRRLQFATQPLRPGALRRARQRTRRRSHRRQRQLL